MEDRYFSAETCAALKIYAIIGFAATLVLIVWNFRAVLADKESALLLASVFLNIAGAGALIFLYIFPRQWQVWTVLHTVQAVKLGMWDNQGMSLLLYAAGWFIAMKAGFFKRMRKRKIAAVAALFVIIFIKSFLAGPLLFLSDIFKIGVLGGILMIVMQFFAQKPTAGPAALPPPADVVTPQEAAGRIINLKTYNFTDEEEYCIYAILHKAPYKKIARILNTSESSLKRALPKIYKCFNVETHKQFYELLKTSEILYSGADRIIKKFGAL